VAVAALTPVIWGAATPELHDEVVRRLSHLFPRLVARLAHHQYVESVWRSRLAAVTIRPRLRLVLHRMARELGTQRDKGILLDFRVTSGMLAELVGGNRDEVGRAVRELLAEGLVERQPGRRMWVPDPTALVEGILPDEG
jgi:CRP-like cAMP-binding protein